MVRALLAVLLFVTAAARKASEEDAGGGSLTEKVESVFLTPTDYSAMK